MPASDSERPPSPMTTAAPPKPRKANPVAGSKTEQAQAASKGHDHDRPKIGDQVRLSRRDTPGGQDEERVGPAQPERAGEHRQQPRPALTLPRSRLGHGPLDREQDEPADEKGDREDLERGHLGRMDRKDGPGRPERDGGRAHARPGSWRERLTPA